MLAKSTDARTHQDTPKLLFDLQKQYTSPRSAELTPNPTNLDTIRSVPDRAKIPLDNHLAIWEFNKPKFDWHLLLVTKKLYGALVGL